MQEPQSAITAEQFASWLTPQQAYKLLAHLDYRTAIQKIMGRARAGLIQMGAESITVTARGRTSTNKLRLLTPAFIGDAGNQFLSDHTFWTSGDVILSMRDRDSFHPTYDNRFEVAIFNARFEPTGVRGLLQPNDKPRDALPIGLPRENTPIPAPTPHPGGRPKWERWDDLWVEMCRKIWEGEAPFNGSSIRKQSDIVRAMLDWVHESGYELGDTAAKERARKLFNVLKNKD